MSLLLWIVGLLAASIIVAVEGGSNVLVIILAVAAFALALVAELGITGRVRQ